MKKLFILLAILGACFSLQSCFCPHDFYDDYYGGPHYRSGRTVYHHQPAPRGRGGYRY